MKSFQKEGDNTCQYNNIMEGWPHDMTFVVFISPLYIYQTQKNHTQARVGFEIYAIKLREKKEFGAIDNWEIEMMMDYQKKYSFVHLLMLLLFLSFLLSEGIYMCSLFIDPPLFIMHHFFAVLWLVH